MITYRLSWPMSLLPPGIGVASGITFAASTDPEPVRLGVLAATLAVSLPVIACLAVGLRCAALVSISHAGLRGFDTLMRLRTYSWASVRSAKPMSIAGLRVLRIYSDQSRWAIWLPLQLTDRRAFWMDVETMAPPMCPVRDWLPAAA